VIRRIAAAVLGASLLFLVAWPVWAAQATITSVGPLTQIIVSDTLSCQVAHRDDQQFELYPPSSEAGSCGTFLAMGNTVYGPVSGNATSIPWTPASQSPVAGSGSASDPFHVVTAVEAPDIGIRVHQTDTYAVGSQSYQTDIEITNASAEPRVGILYRAGDCYLQEDDDGYGRVDNGAPACIVDPANGRRIEQWTPITPGSHFFEGYYDEAFSIIRAQQQYPDRCDCDTLQDNGAGLSWSVNLGAGQSVVISHETFFSPVGRGPVQQSFQDSVPDPTKISLDPVVIASSVAVTAGVIMLVPFPSALFNSTLEENYEEVMAGVGRIRAWIARMAASVRAWIRKRLEQRRMAAAGGAPPPPGFQPQPGFPPAAGFPAEPGFQPQPGFPPAAGFQAPPGPYVPPPPEPIAAPLASTAPPDVWRTPLGMLGFVLLSSLLYGFLDPTFGFSLTSLATFLGLALGLIVVLLAYGLPLFYFSRRHGLPLTVRALPATLLIGVICVVISRVVNFQPGYLYGLVIGFFFAHTITRQQEGPAEATAAGASLLVAFLAWVALAVLRAGQTGPPDLVTATLEAASVTIVVAGLENAVFAMLPLRFLPGAAVFDWNRRVWIVLIALGLFGFAHVLLNPSAGYLADTTRTSFFTLILLLLAFGVASVLFWAYFRFRPKRAAHA
jgi:hypothetical protein